MTRVTIYRKPREWQTFLMTDDDFAQFKEWVKSEEAENHKIWYISQKIKKKKQRVRKKTS